MEDEEDDESIKEKHKDGRCDSSSSLTDGMKDIDIKEGTVTLPPNGA